MEAAGACTEEKVACLSRAGGRESGQQSRGGGAGGRGLSVHRLAGEQPGENGRGLRPRKKSWWDSPHNPSVNHGGSLRYTGLVGWGRSTGPEIAASPVIDHGKETQEFRARELSHVHRCGKLGPSHRSLNGLLPG